MNTHTHTQAQALSGRAGSRTRNRPKPTLPRYQRMPAFPALFFQKGGGGDTSFRPAT